MKSANVYYTRSMDNCVAFGAVLPGRPKTEHQPNEHISLDDMLIAMNIYGEAVKGLLEEEK